MNNLYWLEQVQSADYTLVGDKAFYLSRAVQLGYPVLPGFVVSANVWRQFIESLNGAEPLVADLPKSSLRLDVNDPRQLQQVATRLHQEIVTTPLPPEWVTALSASVECWEKIPAVIFRPSLAVRNSDRLNLSTLLDAQVCPCHREAMALALKQTWSQLFRAKSLFYWRRMGIELQQINLAVLVQPLFNAIASGTLSYQSNSLEIRATRGLGMALGRGEVLPDSYFIQPNTGVVLKRDLGNKTIAYGLLDDARKDLQPLLPDSKSYLQSYVLGEVQQYALSEEHLQTLIQLTQRLRSELGSNFTLKWTIPEAEKSKVEEIYLTRLTSSTTITSSPVQPLRGLGAAAGKVVAPAHVISQHEQKPTSLPPGVILVVPALPPDWLPLLQQASGVVTEQGGLTSHSAILARELGIPAVVNVKHATKSIRSGETIVVDGERGEVSQVRNQLANSSKIAPATLPYILSKSEKAASTIDAVEAGPGFKIRGTFDEIPNRYTPIATQLFVNLSQPYVLERIKSLPVDGLGLLRSELMVLSILEGQHPNVWLQQGRAEELLERWQEQIRHFARAFSPKPVFYRSLDWRSHEFSSLYNDSSVTDTPLSNSMLGVRGTFSYLQNPTLFDLELKALASVQRSGYSNLRLLLPFVRTVEEVVFCRRRVEQAGLAQSQFQLWIMAEVPSVLFLLPEYVKAGVQGISIGTNDLTQLLLGVDRDRGELAAAFDERHPVVMSAIAQIIQMARQANIPCSICGQAPALYPEIIDSLVHWGITSISVEPDAVEQTYNAIARAEQRLILAAARRQ